MANFSLSRFPAKMESMAEIRTFVEEACANAGIGREDCLKILLIVEELFTNTVTHGYREESESPVWMAFEPGDTGFTLVYEDAAPPHNPFGEFRPHDTAALIAHQPVATVAKASETVSGSCSPCVPEVEWLAKGSTLE